MALKFKKGDEVQIADIETLKKLYSGGYHTLRQSMERRAGTIGIVTACFADNVYHLDEHNNDYWYSTALEHVAHKEEPWHE